MCTSAFVDREYNNNNKLQLNYLLIICLNETFYQICSSNLSSYLYDIWSFYRCRQYEWICRFDWLSRWNIFLWMKKKRIEFNLYDQHTNICRIHSSIIFIAQKKPPAKCLLPVVGFFFSNHHHHHFKYSGVHKRTHTHTYNIPGRGNREEKTFFSPFVVFFLEGTLIMWWWWWWSLLNILQLVCRQQTLILLKMRNYWLPTISNFISSIIVIFFYTNRMDQLIMMIIVFTRRYII